MLFVGDDWAEDHHDIEIVDDAGQVLARKRFPEGLDGVTGLHAVPGAHDSACGHHMDAVGDDVVQ